MIKLPLSIGILLISTALFAQIDFNDPVAYNGYIVSEQHKTVQQNLDYISFSVHSDDYRAIEAKRRLVLKQINKSTDYIRKMPAFKGDRRMRDEALEVFRQYKNTFERDFKEIMALKRARENSFEAMEAYFKMQNKAEERVNKAMKRFNQAQSLFVKDNNLTFGDQQGENDLTKKMEQIAAVNQYARDIFLEYFRVSKSFAEMLDVLNQQKPGPLDRKRKEVLELVDQVLPRLRKYGGFNGYEAYVDQTIYLVAYYQGLATNEFVEIVALFTKKKGIDQRDANYINGVLREYNRKIQSLTNNLHDANEVLLQQNVAPIK